LGENFCFYFSCVDWNFHRDLELFEFILSFYYKTILNSLLSPEDFYEKTKYQNIIFHLYFKTYARLISIGRVYQKDLKWLKIAFSKLSLKNYFKSLFYKVFIFLNPIHILCYASKSSLLCS
jgi:hypothetical protein